jgi:FtsZ-binding cell division protein ZapB
MGDAQLVAQLRSDIQAARGVYTDTVTNGDKLYDTSSTLSAANQNASQQMDALANQENALKAELAATKQKVSALDKDFLENIYGGNPEAGAVPTIQDFALLIFWLGWLSLIVTIFTVRILSPGSNWKNGLLLFSLLLFATVLVYAVLRQFA